MSAKPQSAQQLPVSELRNTGPTRFHLEPDANARTALADELGAQSIKKLRFDGEISPHGRNGWQLSGKLGATAVQTCIATLEPITTRIDTDVIRRYVPATKLRKYEAGTEHEMTEDDDDIEELGDTIDLAAIMAEELSLALPAYPRKVDAPLQETRVAAKGVAPLQDQDMRPFAGLAALRDKMSGDGDDSDNNG